MAGNKTFDPSVGNEPQAAPLETDHRSMYWAVLIIAVFLSIGFGWCLRAGLPQRPPLPPPPSGSTEEEDPEKRQRFVEEHLQSSKYQFQPHHHQQEEEQPECTICLAPIVKGDRVSTSNNSDCPHSFHRECVYQWLLKHKECPMCRNFFLMEEEEENSVEDRSSRAGSSRIRVSSILVEEEGHF